MAYIKLLSDKQGSYRFGYFNENESIGILGLFLTSDVRCSKDGISFFKEWALAEKADPNSKFNYSLGANITFLEEENNYIYLRDRYSEEANPTELKISREQFVKLLDDWQEKVCKSKPKEVTITEKNGEFSIETKD